MATTKQTTTIQSNGSKWHGESPDPVSVLAVRIRRYTLIPRSFRRKKLPDGSIQFAGNFLEKSTVFNIITNNPRIIRMLSKYMADNFRRQRAAA